MPLLLGRNLSLSQLQELSETFHGEMQAESVDLDWMPSLYLKVEEKSWHVHAVQNNPCCSGCRMGCLFCCTDCSPKAEEKSTSRKRH